MNMILLALAVVAALAAGWYFIGADWWKMQQFRKGIYERGAIAYDVDTGKVLGRASTIAEGPQAMTV